MARCFGNLTQLAVFPAWDVVGKRSWVLLGIAGPTTTEMFRTLFVDSMIMKKLFGQSLAVLFVGLLFTGCADNGHTDSGAQADNNGDASGAGTQTSNPALSRPQLGTKNTIPFKGSKEGIMKQMAKVSGAEIRKDTITQNGEGLAYSGGRFGGFPVLDWSFRFLNGQMLFSQMNFGEEMAGVSSDSIYAAFSAMLEQWYGPPVLNSDVQITSLNDYNEEEQQFISKIGSSLYGDFKLWSIGTNTEFLATINKVQWNQAQEQYFVHLAFYDRAQSEVYFNQMQP